MKQKIVVKCPVCDNEFIRISRPGERGRPVTQSIQRDVKNQRPIFADTCSQVCSKKLTKIVIFLRDKRPYVRGDRDAKKNTH